MEYILDSVDKLEDGVVTKKSYHVQNRSVRYVNERMDRLTFPRINTEGFYLQPGFVMNDFTIAQDISWGMFKQHMHHLVTIGCTTIITYCHVRYEKQLSATLKKARHRMINSSIDYVVGISTTAKALSPSMIRACIREKVPIIIVEISSAEELSLVAWGRLREAMLTYKLLIVPVPKKDAQVKTAQQINRKWEQIATAYRVPTSLTFPSEHVPLSKSLLKLIGLYPKKGELLVGSDIDYNLFLKHSEMSCPDIVVLKGNVLKAGETLYACPGFGKEIKIIIPGQFISIKDAIDTSMV